MHGEQTMHCGPFADHLEGLLGHGSRVSSELLRPSHQDAAYLRPLSVSLDCCQPLPRRRGPFAKICGLLLAVSALDQVVRRSTYPMAPADRDAIARRVRGLYPSAPVPAASLLSKFLDRTYKILLSEFRAGTEQQLGTGSRQSPTRMPI